MVPRLFVYIAGPLTKPSPMHNVHAAVTAGDQVMAAGHYPYIPHLDTLWDLISPHHYEDWIALDLAWLQKADCLVRLPGESSGADREVAEAQRLGIKVFFGLPEFFAAHPIVHAEAR